MFPGNVEYIARERHQEALRQAERQRLIQSFTAQPAAPSAGPQPGPIYWLGGQLVKWGLRLQGQSSALPPAATPDLNYC
ncbi:MAG: hypothetical protein AB1801_11885 [Chloroflexota bacterium]